MSKYTTQIRNYIEEICLEDEYTPASTGTAAIDDKINHAKSMLFDFNYPINQSDKDRFEKNFVRHFYMREIGAETMGLFKLFLADELNLLIPKYNKLWEEATKYADYNMLDNVDLNTARVGSHAGNRNRQNTKTDTGYDVTNDIKNETSKSNDTNNSQRVNEDNATKKYSDTPQGSIQNVANGSYLTNVTIDDSTSNENTNGSSSSARDNSSVGNSTRTTDRHEAFNDAETEAKTSNESERITGKNGGAAYAELIIKLRETYINIDRMLCDELEPLFMQIW